MSITLDKITSIQQKNEENPAKLFLRALLAELVGTFALTFVAAGSKVLGEVSNGKIDRISQMVAPGLLVMAFIYTLGEVSGAHFNPAVSLAFTLRRDFPWRKLPAYWLAQLAGAILAALLLQALFGAGPLGKAGVSHAEGGTEVALVMEIILTGFLVMVILGTSSESRLVGPNAALAVGATIALCGLISDPISAASMNPARSLGPALVAGGSGLAQVWIYLLGPFGGSLIALGLSWLVHGKPKPQEKKAAQGRQDDH